MSWNGDGKSVVIADAHLAAEELGGRKLKSWDRIVIWWLSQKSVVVIVSYICCCNCFAIVRSRCYHFFSCVCIFDSYFCFCCCLSSRYRRSCFYNEKASSAIMLVWEFKDWRNERMGITIGILFHWKFYCAKKILLIHPHHLTPCYFIYYEWKLEIKAPLCFILFLILVINLL